MCGQVHQSNKQKRTSINKKHDDNRTGPKLIPVKILKIKIDGKDIIQDECKHGKSKEAEYGRHNMTLLFPLLAN